MAYVDSTPTPASSPVTQFESAFEKALLAAEAYRGATAPNPPVGAVALSQDGEILAIGAHERVGMPHAERGVIEACQSKGLLSRVHTLIVTLEPCSHEGRTPPCTDAILDARIPRVIYALRDQNLRVSGKGAEVLRQQGVEVSELETLWGNKHPLMLRAQELVRPFFHWMRTGLPWVTLKIARRPDGSMIPPHGQRTFTSAESLKLAHELRKRSNAIITGSGTILKDSPQFTVRHVPDHPSVSRYLVMMDREGRIPESYFEQARNRGFSPIRATDFKEALRFLGSKGCLEVLVEAGPSLVESIEKDGLWNERVIIHQFAQNQEEVMTDVYWHH